MNKGKYIVLEGAEGVGKTAQMQELERRLRLAGLPVRVMREPDSLSDLAARAIRRLTQDPRYPMNTATEVLLYNAARSQSLQVIRNSTEHGVTCLVDRNYLTTLAIQYYGRGDISDYETIDRIIAFAVQGIEPDLCIVLDAPVPVLIERQQRRSQGERFDNLDAAFLERVRAGYLWEAKQRNMPVVFATDNIGEVANTIWNLVVQTLAIRDASKQAGMSRSVPPESVLDQLIAHEPPISVRPLTIERNTGTTEVASDAGQNPHPLQIEDMLVHPLHVSQLLAQELELGGIAEPCGDGEDNAAYYIPDMLADAMRQRYVAAMDELLAVYDASATQLTRYLTKRMPEATSPEVAKLVGAHVQSILPLAILAPITLNTSATAAQISAASELAEAGRLVHEGAEDGGENGLSVPGTNTDKLRVLARSYTSLKHASEPRMLALADWWPRNEMDAIADILYQYGADSLDNIRDSTDALSYEQKIQLYKTYLTAAFGKSAPDSPLQRVSYTWDLLTGSTILHAFLRLKCGSAITAQTPTPRNGYDVPALIEESGLADAFERCFDLSLDLYSALQQDGHDAVAQYACLQGHHLRWKVTLHPSELLSLFGDATLRPLAEQMQIQLAAVHPLMAKSLLSSMDPEPSAGKISPLPTTVDEQGSRAGNEQLQPTGSGPAASLE